MDQGLDRPSHLTSHWARLGPGDGARHARPTSTEGFAPGFAPVCTRVCTRQGPNTIQTARPKSRNGALRPPRPLPDPRRVRAYPRPPPRALAASVVRLQTSALVPSVGRGTSSRHVLESQRPVGLGSVEPGRVRDRWADARALRRRFVRHRGPEAVQSAVFCTNVAL